MKSLFFIFAVGGGISAALYAGLLQPPSLVEQRLRAKLAARGITIHGEVRWEEGWRLSDLRARRPGLEVQIERARLPAQLGDWLSGRIGEVHVEGITVTLDEAGARRLARRGAPAGSTTGDAALSPRLEALDLRGSRLVLKTPWAEVMVPSFTVKRVEGAWRGGAPMIAIAAKGQPDLLHAQATLEGDRLTVKALNAGAPIFACGDADDRLQLKAARIDLRARSLSLMDVAVTRPGLEARLEEAQSSGAGLTLKGGHLKLKRWRPKLTLPCLQATTEVKFTTAAPAPSLRARLLKRGIKLYGLKLTTPEGQAFSIKQGRASQEGLDLLLERWGGVITVKTGPLGPELLPEALDLKAEGLDLSQLPRLGLDLGGRADASAALKLKGGVEAGCADLKLKLRGASVAHGSIAKAPLTNINAEGGGRLCWAEGAATLEAAYGQLEQLRVEAEATLSRGRAGPLLKLSAVMDEVGCQAAVDALPRALLGPYARIKLKGRVAPSLKLSYPLKEPAKLDFTVKGLKRRCHVMALNAPRGAQPPLRNPVPGLDDVLWLNEPFVFDVREGIKDDAAVAVGPGTSGYAPIEGLPTYVGGAAYLSEEMGFYRGWALSWPLIKRGLRLSLAKGRFVYGGSTVTQQLVKNLFLTRDKTLARKLREALIASRVQDMVTRDRILELYLNCIEFGPNVYGIDAASRHYFQKAPQALKPKEAVFLAMLKPAPYQGRWFKERGVTPDYPWWTNRIEELMERLVKAEMITAEEAEADRPYTLRWERGRYMEE